MPSALACQVLCTARRSYQPLGEDLKQQEQNRIILILLLQFLSKKVGKKGRTGPFKARSNPVFSMEFRLHPAHFL